jgi:dTDP-4-amino-4,6-dideoxygalactose transaminase
MNIPFIDLKAQYQSIKDHIDRAITEALGDFCFLNGQQINVFEEKFAATIGSRHAIGVANGTDALFLSLKAIGIGPGDEVITPAWSWISSAETISLCGGTPVFADVDPSCYTLNPEAANQKITRSTKAILAVNLYGQAAPLIQLKQLCERHNLILIEDCAQSHLTSIGTTFTGCFGQLSAFSFYPTKNLGAFGDAGCVLTNDEKVAEKVRRLANHGALRKDDHAIEGTNSRMDTIQAAILLAKLPFLKEWTARRGENARLYGEIIGDLAGVTIPVVRENTAHSYHLYVIRSDRRDALKKYLQKEGIQTMIHYPRALTSLPAYGYLNLNSGDYPVANALEKEVLSLPIVPELEHRQIVYIGEKIRAFYKEHAV